MELYFIHLRSIKNLLNVILFIFCIRKYFSASDAFSRGRLRPKTFLKPSSRISSMFKTLNVILFVSCVFTYINPSDSYRIRKLKVTTTTVKPKPVGISPMFKTSRLCSGYTSDTGPPFRYHKETNRCYMVGDKGPCPDLMKFSLVDDEYGTCDCDHSRRCGRPLLYWSGTQRCYFVNSQGPCAPGKWLVFGYNLHPICKSNRCLKEQTEDPSTERGFWYYYQGKCYKTLTQGYCKGDEFLFNNLMEYRPTCNKETLCNELPIVHKKTCHPGSKMDSEGKCARKYIYKE